MAQDLDEIITRTTISFPKRLQEEEIGKLLEFIAQEFIAQEFHGQIRYKYDTSVTIDGEKGIYDEGNGVAPTLRVTREINIINGTIQRNNRFHPFSCYKEFAGQEGFTFLKFFAPPEDTVNDLHPEALQLYDDTRQAVHDYFALRNIQTL